MLFINQVQYKLKTTLGLAPMMQGAHICHGNIIQYKLFLYWALIIYFAPEYVTNNMYNARTKVRKYFWYPGITLDSIDTHSSWF